MTTNIFKHTVENSTVENFSEPVELRSYAEIMAEISEVKRVTALTLKERVAYYVKNYGGKTKSKTVFCKPLGCYISLPLTKDNSKLKGIYIFDLLAVETCLNCRSCRDFCYATKAQKQYINTLLRRSVMTYLAKHFRAWLETAISNQIKRNRRIKYVRIHSAGDFFSTEYLQIWHNIARKFPKVTFYYYTKVDHLIDFSGFNDESNVNGVASILPEGEINFGSPEYVAELLRKYGDKIHVCPYHDPATRQEVRRLDANWNWRTYYIYPEIHCGRDCKICMSHKYVVFYIH